MMNRWSVYKISWVFGFGLVMIIIFIVLGSIRFKKFNDNRKVLVRLESDDQKYQKTFQLIKSSDSFQLFDYDANKTSKKFIVNSKGKIIHKFKTDENGYLITIDDNYVIFDQNDEISVSLNNVGSKLKMIFIGL